MNPYLIIFALCAVIGAFVAGERAGESHAHAADLVSTETLKAQAATTLAAETDKTRKAEQALQDLTNTQNLKDADHEKLVSDIAGRLRAAADSAGRLRDPNAATVGCWPSGRGAAGAVAGAASDRPGDASEADGVLSVQLTELLQQLTASADTINDAYASCRTIAIKDRTP
jgi:hypothetical protein